MKRWAWILIGAACAAGAGAAGAIEVQAPVVKARARVRVEKIQGDEAFVSDLRRLASMSRERIGAIGGGPVMPGDDVLIARRLILAATAEQLDALLSCDNVAVRAHAAREIIHERPTEVARTWVLLKDRAFIVVGSMADTPPIRDRRLRVGDFVRGELRLADLPEGPTAQTTR